MKKKIQKPFDIESAKNGAKVETRDGMPVRIICYDKVDGIYPIIALVNHDGYETCNGYTPDGKLFCSEHGEHDLVIIEETKFNFGDWVFAKNLTGYPLLITAVTPHCYVLQDNGYKTEMYQTTVDTFYRLWTLKDAKPGDVLIYEDDSHPFIFKELVNSALTAYCGIDAFGTIFISGEGRLMWTRSPIRPATSEERQQFFNKLEEEGYKWDAESLTLSKIQKRWRDNEKTNVNGYYIHSDSFIVYRSGYNNNRNHNIFATKKQVKSALAMARISQIMANDERFGGIVTDEEWCDGNWLYVIIRADNDLEIALRNSSYAFLAFHTREQAELFLKENEDLVKDYYMMD